jgi:hypothetical protein
MRHPDIDPRFQFAHDKSSELEVSFPGVSLRITAPESSDDEDFSVEVIISGGSDSDDLSIDDYKLDVSTIKHDGVVVAAIVRITKRDDIIQGQQATPKPGLKEMVEERTAQRMAQAKSLVEADALALAAMFPITLNDEEQAEYEKKQKDLADYADKMQRLNGYFGAMFPGLFHRIPSQVDDADNKTLSEVVSHLPEQPVDDQLSLPEVGDRVRSTVDLRLHDDEMVDYVYIQPGDGGAVEAAWSEEEITIRWDKGATNDCSIDEFEVEDDDEN